MRYALVVNPAAGRGRAVGRAARLRARLVAGAEVETLVTTARGSAVELAASAAARVDRLVAVGGDGTFNEVVTGVVRSGLPPGDRPALAFLAAGTGNAAVRAFGLRRRPEDVADVLPRAELRPLDVGLAEVAGGRRAFVLWLGAGWDAVVIHAMNAERGGRMGFAGLAACAPRIARELSRYPEPRIAVSADGTSFGAHASVIVANVGAIPYTGRVGDGIDPGDGALDVVGVPPATLLRTLRLSGRLLTTGLTRSSEVRRARARTVRLTADGPVPLHLDGEAAGELPATVTVAPGAVRLLVT